MDEYFDYANEVGKILLFMQVIKDIDIDSILETISSADTLGPFIDPTKYRDALQRGDMRDIEILCSGLKVPIKYYNEKIYPKQLAENEKQGKVSNVAS